MKTSSLILAATLALNFLLLAVIAAAFLNRPVPLATPSVATPMAVKTEPPLDPAVWRNLAATDFAEHRRRLEAEGFPSAAIRAIITAQVRDSFAARRRALEAAKTAAPFWKNPEYDPALQAEYRALAREERQAVRAVLGPDLESPVMVNLRRHLPGVSGERLEEVAAINERYLEQRMAARDQQRGITTPDDREKMLRLDKAQHAELARVLTPQELEEYELRTSSTASSLRYSLRGFEPTEAEYRMLYRVNAEFSERFPFTASRTPEESQQYSNARKQKDTQIAAALGVDRYAEYKRLTDYNYAQTSRLVSRFGLPAETADALYAVQQEFQTRRDALIAARTSTSEALTALQADATRRIQSILGDNTAAIEAYKEYGGTWWRHLAPTPPRARK